MEGTYFVKTDFGKFRIQKSSGSNNYKGKNLPYGMLKIGGKKNCIEMKWYSDEDTCELQWLDITELLECGCESSDTIIKGEETVLLLHLAITLLKQYQNVKTLHFLDNSKIHCRLPSSQIEKMSLQRYYFLRHQKTWYEAKFGAYPKNAEEIKGYERMKENFNTLLNGQFFDFRNRDLQEEFMPLYESSSTWASFFEKIKGADCSKFAPWYMSAFGSIAESYKMPEYWLIDTDTTPTISYTITQGGGRGCTRKQRKQTRKNTGIFFSNNMDTNTLRPSELYEIRYK